MSRAKPPRSSQPAFARGECLISFSLCSHCTTTSHTLHPVFDASFSSLLTLRRSLHHLSFLHPIKCFYCAHHDPRPRRPSFIDDRWAGSPSLHSSFFVCLPLCILPRPARETRPKNDPICNTCAATARPPGKGVSQSQNLDTIQENRIRRD